MGMPTALGSLRRPNQLQPVHDRHIEVGDDEVELAGLRLGEPLRAVAGLDHVVTGRLEHDLDHLTDAGGIVDRENRGHQVPSFFCGKC
ncbi:hypothetical protein J2R91_003541 [Bradyrhizobium japonicum]|nr:hypothetical protein [Bradyrhizobium japonicum]MCP1959971.1 hypothetical protein [Bradyrhizobium japonicum]